MEVRLRRAHTLLTYWKNGQLVFENYRTRVCITAAPETLAILDFFGRWRRPDELISQFSEYTRESVQAALRQLVEYTLLVRENTPEAQQDSRMAKVWSAWLPHASFHFSTKDVPFLSGRKKAQLFRRYLTESQPPRLFKRYGKVPRVKLPPFRAADGEFPRTLLARRTQRQFAPRALPLGTLAELLFYTWGITGFVQTPLLGRLPLKTSPSGGARHPGEVYVAALNVAGLPPGLYHYDTARHSLECLRSGPMQDRALRYCAGQKYVRNAAALFLMTAVFLRSMWKYRFARAYRVVLLDAGHLCQTFCLTATWLGLAPFCTAALKDSLIEKDLGVDGITESVLYVAGVGLPHPGVARAVTLRNLF